VKRAFCWGLIIGLLVAGPVYGQEREWPDYEELGAGLIADGDDVMLNDVSDTTDDERGTLKRYSWANLKASIKAYLDAFFQAIDSDLDDLANGISGIPLGAGDEGGYSAASPDEHYAAARHFIGLTTNTFTADDATPDITNGGALKAAQYLWQSNGSDGHAVTITDFHDSDGDHSDFNENVLLGLWVDDAYTTIDLSANANIIGNSGVDFTGSATIPMLLIFQFRGAAWHAVNLVGGISTPVTMGIANLKLPTITTGNATLTEGRVTLKTHEDAIAAHFGANGEVQTEALISALIHLSDRLDPAWAYDQEDTYRIRPIMKIGDDFPHGFTIVEWRASFVSGTRTTALDMDLVCDTTPDFNPAAGGTVMDAMDIANDAQASSADSGFDSATCANGSELYFRFGADPTDANELLMVEIWGYAEED
jgi:hypothetical protein